MSDSGKLDRLGRAFDDLREDFSALVKCLEMFGAVREPWLHAVRFHKTLERHPLGGGGRSLTDVLDSGMLRTILQMCGGEREEILAVREASSASKALVDTIQAEKLYIFNGADAHGGGNQLRTAESFDPCVGAWSPLPPTELPRDGCVAGVVRGRVYLCGGWGEFGQIITWFNPRRQEWETTRPAPRLSSPRKHAAAVASGGRLYICGGDNTIEDTVHRSIECFDPTLARCEVLPAMMLAPRGRLVAAALPGQGKELLVCGGNSTPGSWYGTPRASPALETVETLNLSGGGSTWQYFAPMIIPRMVHAVATLNGSIYVVGGTEGLGLTPSGERFHPEVGSWQPLPQESVQRGGLVASTLCGHLFIFGGNSLGGVALRTGERFDTLRQTWEPAADMEEGRVYFASAVVKVGALAA